MCEHSVHGHATELEAQQEVISVFVDQLSEPWKDSSSFFISMCWNNTVREREWVTLCCLCTKWAGFLSSLDPLTPALNPHLFIAFEHVCLSCLIHFGWVNFRQKLFVISRFSQASLYILSQYMLQPHWIFKVQSNTIHKNLYAFIGYNSAYILCLNNHK